MMKSNMHYLLTLSNLVTFNVKNCVIAGLQRGCHHNASRMCPQCVSVQHSAWLSHFPVENGARSGSDSARCSSRNQKSCEVKVSMMLCGRKYSSLSSLSAHSQQGQ